MRVSQKSFFFVHKSIIELSTSLLLDKNQLTLAKLDKILFSQLIERIPELRFKYMGSYHSDKKLRLTKYLFAFNKSAPSKC